MTVLVLLEQTCKSDSSMNQACYKLLTACSKLVPTAWNEQSEQTCQQLVNRFVKTYLQVCHLCVFRFTRGEEIV